MLKSSIGILSTSLLALVLTGCASISKEECLAGNWEQLGYRDASSGYDSNRIGSHMEECGKVGVQIDRNLYNKGYQDGLKVFCTYDKGLQIGKENGYYREICPADLAADFHRGYMLGQQIHKIEAQISGIETEMQALETQLSKEVLSYERRRIASDIATKRALVTTLRTQVTILESQSMGRRY
jgi:hypothetical protein